MEHRGDLVDVLRVHNPRNDRSDFWAVFVRGCAAFDQTYRICVVNCPLDGCDQCLVARFHYGHACRRVAPASSMNWPSIDGTYVELAVCVVNRDQVAILDAKHAA